MEELAIKELGDGFHWLFPPTVNEDIYKDFDFSIVGYPPGDNTSLDFFLKIKKKLIGSRILKGPLIISEQKYLSLFKNTLKNQLRHPKFMPCLLSGWDNTPRYKERGFLINSKISDLLKNQFKILIDSLDSDKKIDFLFVKAWNEWAEGNVLEPHDVEGITDDPSLLILDFKSKLSSK